MIQLEGVVSDRGSRYAVSGVAVRSRAEVDAFIKALKKKSKYAKATHNTWAVILSDGGPIKNDDGESGAGAVILKMLDREALHDVVVVVTRWLMAKVRPPSLEMAINTSVSRLLVGSFRRS